MNISKSFQREFITIALPVALQGLLQSSFSIVDQVMVGQLGEVSIAGIGLAGRFASLYSVLLSAIAAAAGILLAQYIGKQDEKEAGRSFYLNLFLAAGLAVLFLGLCLAFPQKIMGIYTEDPDTRAAAALYLSIVAVGFLPRAVSLLCATLLRCKNYASVPLYATAGNAILDTALSYALIFGKFGLPRMGIAGAAAATVFAQAMELFVTCGYCLWLRYKGRWKIPFLLGMKKELWKRYAGILMPILACEFFWSLGENVYGMIYGRLGTKPCAAMTLIGPIVMLFMGLMGGISQAAGILTGKRLGAKEYGPAYQEAKKMMWYGLIGSGVLAVFLLATGRYYVSIFEVDDGVRKIALGLLKVFAVIAPVKVQNMILGGGIIRSGGKTKYLMAIDLIGTWGLGVPIGLVSALVLKLSIVPVYFLLSLEECVRLAITVVVFRKKRWMRGL